MKKQEVPALKKGEKIWELFTDATDLSEENLPGQPIVEIAGENRVLIENHLGIKGYSQEQIVVKVKYGEIHVCGSCLDLMRMSLHRLMIRGVIRQVILCRRC